MKILKSRRGIAIENAIAFMLIIFLLCALLSSLMLFGVYQNKLDKVKLTMRAELDQIGENFVSLMRSNLTESFTLDNNSTYACCENVNSGKHVLTVWKKSDESQTVLLYIEVQIDTNGFTLQRWCYCNPNPTNNAE